MTNPYTTLQSARGPIAHDTTRAGQASGAILRGEAVKPLAHLFRAVTMLVIRAFGLLGVCLFAAVLMQIILEIVR